MTIKNYKCSIIDHNSAKAFIIQNHYSKVCPNGYFNFGLFDKDVLIGVAVYGHVVGRRQANYWYPNNPNKLIELRRLACIDNTPRNTESFFISKTIKWLEHNTDFECIISLADPMYGHSGTIYKASNFIESGTTVKEGHPIFIIDGKECHPKTLYHRHGTSSVAVVKNIYKDRLELKERKNKIVFLYKLKSKNHHKKHMQLPLF